MASAYTEPFPRVILLKQVIDGRRSRGEVDPQDRDALLEAGWIVTAEGWLIITPSGMRIAKQLGLIV